MAAIMESAFPSSPVIDEHELPALRPCRLALGCQRLACGMFFGGFSTSAGF